MLNSQILARESSRQSIALIVARPTDETLWAGGTLLLNPDWDVFICCLSGADDPSKAACFSKALDRLEAKGAMSDLADAADPFPLSNFSIRREIRSLLPEKAFDIIFSHSPDGEYTRNVRHEEIGKAVIELWGSESISTQEMRLFAYEDGNSQYSTRAITKNTRQTKLDNQTWRRKLMIMTDVYGFERSSWEAQTTPRIEAFHCFNTASEAASYFDFQTGTAAAGDR